MNLRPIASVYRKLSLLRSRGRKGFIYLLYKCISITVSYFYSPLKYFIVYSLALQNPRFYQKRTANLMRAFLLKTGDV